MNTRIGGTPGTTNTYGTTGTEQTQETQTGGGIGGMQNGGAPDPAAPGYGSILEGLRNFMPELGSESFETRLAEITSKLKEITSQVHTDRVLNEQETKRLNMKENEAKIEESEKKLDEAEAKRKSGNIFDKISMAFQALGAFLMIAIGAALAAVPGMQAVGALMIAGGVIMAVSLINSIVQEETGAGIAGNLAKAIDPDISDDALMAIDMAFTITLAVAGIVAAVASGRVDAAVQGFAGLSASVAKAAVETVRTVAAVAAAVTQAGSAVAQVGSAGYGLSAAEDQADAMDLQADSQAIQALMQQLDDLIDQALAMLMGASDRFNAMLDQITEMNKDSGDTLSATRFAG
ncbi:type III secretion system translocon subunit SctE [Pseudooceanicola aestuarii]|uniref:type III secretion system translocon subunit SctE n=1 Tax=Pseudooceanicola aestuarii TaxID=2697319 RepID=UPI0013D2CE9E|nr:type III secretion system translocon subunit SctE [Pseudooceanicola aestuarii]